MIETNPAPGIRKDIVTWRETLAVERTKLESQHDNGSPGIQVCAKLTDVLDGIVIATFEAALARASAETGIATDDVVLVAHGGYGRREMAPYSDLDLMLLYNQGSLSQVSPLARELVQDLSDLGLDLGFSLRSVRQAIQMAPKDPIIFTSLLESRCLAGSDKQFERFVHRFRRMTQGRVKTLLRTAEAARREERSKYGEAVHLLEPDVKRSKGGLRDLQLLRWIGFIRYGHSDFNMLHRSGQLEEQDYRQIRKALEFLLRLRNELHFHAKTSRDTLHRHEQQRIAEKMGFEGEDGVLPVERFMTKYFQHTEAIRHIGGYFSDGARWKLGIGANVINYVAGMDVDGDYRIGPNYITVNRFGLEKVKNNVSDILRLMELSNAYDRRIDYPTWDAIRSSMMERTELKVDKETSQRFQAFLSHTSQLGKLIRKLHELRVLEKLIPGFKHARCLLQFNEYHKFTVDEHSIRAVELAVKFEREEGTLGNAYREINRKWLLHLALLVHDLGKGFPEDHSEVGARIAIETARHLHLDEETTETLRFLVHRHLMLSHLAFRRDTSDEALIKSHVDEIGSAEKMKMLFVLTCADFAAVGPGVLNKWKIDVLSGLFERMVVQFDDQPDPHDSTADLQSDLFQQANIAKDPWLERQVKELPPAYLEGPSCDQIMDDLKRLKDLPPNGVAVWGRYLPDRRAIEYNAGARELEVPGAFHRLTGALSANGLEILSAEIHTLADDFLFDRFYVHDQDFEGEPPEFRFQQIYHVLQKALSDKNYKRPTFRQKWGNQNGDGQTPLFLQPTRIRIDNETSEASTLVEVFAHDKPGLLFEIARILFDLDLSVHHAKIGTYLDQVVDVFYVTDNDDNKITDEKRLELIQQRLSDELSPLVTPDNG